MDNAKIQYKFGPLEIVFASLGVPFLSDSTLAKIDDMSAADLKAANREAWKQRREAARVTHRHNNMSVSGNGWIYHRACQQFFVAELVCKETYKRMMRAH